MAFLGVLMSMGFLAVVAWVMLCITLWGVALLIAALVLCILYQRGKSAEGGPKRWQKITSIVCAIVGGLFIQPAVFILIMSFLT